MNDHHATSVNWEKFYSNDFFFLLDELRAELSFILEFSNEFVPFWHPKLS